MSFNFECPHCNVNLEAEDEWDGLETTCPGCARNITIHRESEEEKAQDKLLQPPSSELHVKEISTLPPKSEGIAPENKPLKSRKIYLLLGIFFAAFGAHDFYAGYTTKGFIKLAITLCCCCTLGCVSSIWGVIDICTVTEDAEGRPFAD